MTYVIPVTNCYKHWGILSSGTQGYSYRRHDNKYSWTTASYQHIPDWFVLHMLPSHNTGLWSMLRFQIPASVFGRKHQSRILVSVFGHFWSILNTTVRFKIPVSDFRHKYPILDTSVRFQALVFAFRNILDTSVHFWTLVSDFEE